MAEGLRIITFCNYTSGEIWCTGPLRQDTFHSKKFIDALKDRHVNGWADIPVPFGGSRRQLTDANKHEAFGWAGEIIAGFAKGGSSRNLTHLVPVPGSKCASPADVKQSGPYLIALEIVKRVKAMAVAPLLYWSEPIASASSESGTRDAAILYPCLVIGQKPRNIRRCVLIDDVKTSGGHLQACEARLSNTGLEVAYAVCVGRTVYDEIFEPFSRQEETIPRYVPD